MAETQPDPASGGSRTLACGIRPIVAADRDAVLGLVWHHLLDELGEPNHGDPDLLNLDREIARAVAGDDDIAFFVAAIGDRVVGAGGVALSFMTVGTAELGWLVIDPDYRVKGLGAALLVRRERWAIERHAELMLLSAGQPEFHERYGYSIVVRSANEAVMAKSLKRPGG
ncbi:MAG: GNAT family N-acetyltransferase [Azospirillum sp.]|nr:GNAT family N-acetyltransferase [Azospirillum sp.]